MVCEGVKLDLIVGSRIGTLKHVRFDQNSIKKRKDTSRHLQDVKSIQKGEGISCLSFKDAEETQVIVGRENRTLQVYDLLSNQFTTRLDVDFGQGRLHSVAVCDDDLILGAVSSGVVKVWNGDFESVKEVNAGADLERLRHCPDTKGVFGTGGKENELKVWDIERGEVIFQAKNVPPDSLQLRVPVWVADFLFLPETDAKQLVMCSRYGVVRLYDTRVQRRPVCFVDFPNQANTCIGMGFREKQVLVGSGRGVLRAVDLRGPGRPDKGYKGPTGAVTQVECLPQQNMIVSTSLDRHLRIHHAQTKELVHKQYMTSKLSCVLVRSSSGPPLLPEDLKAEEEKDIKVDSDAEEQRESEHDSEYEDMFQNMEVIGDESVPRKSKTIKNKIEEYEDLQNTTKTPKRKRNRVKHAVETEEPEVSTPKLRKKRVKEADVEAVAETPPPSAAKSTKREKKKSEKAVGECDLNATPQAELDESIMKLLKSTEKKKKLLEKQKKEKKRKSVFNC